MKNKTKNKVRVLILILLSCAAISCATKQEPKIEDESLKKKFLKIQKYYSSENWETRLTAVKSSKEFLNTSFDSEVMAILLMAVKDPHPKIKIEALRVLSTTTPFSALGILREIALSEDNLNVKAAAIETLGEYKMASNSEIFLKNINHRDWLIREAAFRALLKIEPMELQKNYIGHIIKGINDKNIAVKIAILLNIKIKDQLLYDKISDIIQNRKTKTSLLEAALIAIVGYTLDDVTKERIVELLTHRNKKIRILSLRVLKEQNQNGKD